MYLFMYNENFYNDLFNFVCKRVINVRSDCCQLQKPAGNIICIVFI
jgi:hypothetical protein